MKIIDIVSFALAIFFVSAFTVLFIYAIGGGDDCPDTVGDNYTLKTLIEIIGLLFIAFVMGNFIMPVYEFIKGIITLFIQ